MSDVQLDAGRRGDGVRVEDLRGEAARGDPGVVRGAASAQGIPRRGDLVDPSAQGMSAAGPLRLGRGSANCRRRAALVSARALRSGREAASYSGGSRRREAAQLVLTGSPSSSAQVWSSPDSNRKHVGDEAYSPPLCGSGKFADVPAGSPFCRWIEQLDRDGIMSSCDGGTSFCPDNPVTRKQLAMALGKTARGTATWHPAQGSNWLRRRSATP